MSLLIINVHNRYCVYSCHIKFLCLTTLVNLNDLYKLSSFNQSFLLPLVRAIVLSLHGEVSASIIVEDHKFSELKNRQTVY